ncbi:MAG: AAA family ATPase [Bryobacterales bacterium]|nr:AAA family ATPase [Bryobacterales bacterium]
MESANLIVNPFDSDVVANPAQPVPIDVPEIHREAFESCCREYARAGTESRSVLFHGQSGCGKTHLLSRFRRWLNDQVVRPALFVAVRMETAPSQVWRHLQRKFAEGMLEKPSGAIAPLDIILKRFAKPRDGDLTRAFDEAAIPDVTLDLIRVCEHYAAGRHRRLCRAWFKGESLPEADLAEMKLSGQITESLDEDSGENAARQFVLAMIRICAPEPVVLCFDQLEALSLSAAANSYGPFAKMGATLVDETRNTLVILSILGTFLPDLERQSMASDYRRITKSIADLKPLDLPQGLKLVEARLAAVEELLPYRARGGVAPLNPDDLQRIFTANHGRCTARKLIHEARRLFAAWRGLPEPDSGPFDEFCGKRFEQYWDASEAAADPSQSDEVLARALGEIAGLAGYRITAATGKHIDFEAASPLGPVLLALCNQRNMNSLAARLRRLARSLDEAALKRLCLVRDPRLPISPKARITNQILKDLQNKGARIVRPQPEIVAAIDAMKRILSEATSGDLSLRGEPVETKRVREWLAANLPGGLREMLDSFVAGSTPAEGDALVELLQETKIIAAREAANKLGWTLDQVENYARTNPRQVGLLAGPPSVLYHIVAAPAADRVAYA